MSVDKTKLRALISEEVRASITGLREAVQQAALDAVRTEVQDLHEIQDEIRATATNAIHPAQYGEGTVRSSPLPSLEAVAKLTQ